MVEVIVKNGAIDRPEIDKYVDYLQKKYNRKLKTLTITLSDDGEEVDLNYIFEPVCFERIRRITGYLTGDTSTWNDAKIHELDDRVVHGGMVDINEECSCKAVEYPDGLSVEEASRYLTDLQSRRGE